MRSHDTAARLMVAAAVAVTSCQLEGCKRKLPDPHQVSVLTNNNNNARTGSYYELLLNPSNVNVNALSTFGKIHTWRVTGQIYAQPLYVHQLQFADGSKRNTVFVATEENWVYAFDAQTFSPIWSIHLGPSVKTQGCGNLKPSFGITSTPVIDLDTKTMYVVARIPTGFTLFALDITTNAVKQQTQINGSFRPRQREEIKFEPDRHMNRPGLLLSQGKIYLAFGGICDHTPYHGWVFSYDAVTLQSAGVYMTTPDGDGQGGIWQAGRGLAADPEGNIFLMSGNGEVNFPKGDLGESVIRLDKNLHVQDWFTPQDHACFNTNDLDLGSSGPLLILSQQASGDLLVGGGKPGTFYLLSAPNLGRSNPPLASVLATAPVEWVAGLVCLPISTANTATGHTHHIHGGPVLWDRDGDLLVYDWGENDPVKVFRVRPALSSIGLLAKSKAIAPAGMPGGTLSISHSDDPRTGLLWANLPLEGDAVEKIVKGWLVAFQATPDNGDLALLWHSEMQPGDSVGLYAKFTPPTIADGRVYVASFGDPPDDHQSRGALHVYGLRTSR